jgi:hypothetical protein
MIHKYFGDILLMLINKTSVSVGDTVSFRLNTGEEIIAKLTASDETALTVSKPVVAQMQMIAPNQAGLAFAPFMATADEDTTKFRIERSRLVCDPILPRKDISAKYLEMTTGLVAAPAGLLKA